MSDCSHLFQARPIAVTVTGCEDCLPIGGEWVHLRACQTCGHVACCDRSPNRHATAHFEATGHPVAKSVEPGESWLWCYRDLVGYDPDDVDLEGADLG